MADASKWPALIQRLAQRYGVDPKAALAVASVEGLSGRVGDGGHAFGPFQLNDAGGVITNRPGDHRAFAESPAGIDWAMQRIAQVAKGKTGREAVEAIVKNFERPANIPGEIESASAAYGKGAQVSGGLSSPAPTNQPSGQQPQQGGDIRNLLLGALISRTQQFAQGKPIGTNPGQLLQLAQLAGQQQGTQSGPPAPSPRRTTQSAKVSGDVAINGNTDGLKPSFLNSLQAAADSLHASGIKITSGRRSADHNAAVGGVSHSNHLTGDAVDGYLIIDGQEVPLGTALKSIASKFGLRSGDVDGFFNGRPDPVHVDDGFNQR